eukprot:TRINITY_DN2154_c0_g2_i1.p1 TRINITY_DN2154_c0_g2~~TRINITY_DN2154_c0_g2_i1.p1  ORF type:complete len:290 (+),score=109.11 TRINITY_DN2154_c0_g2_i1:100-870(+)
MNFTVFVPSAASPAPHNFPVLYWLSGLTCTDENFITKAGAQDAATKHGIFLVCPDTSPRGTSIEGQSDSWDFGLGAGFYLNATQPLWSTNFNMYSYVTAELPAIISANFSVADTTRSSIFGHSMGGHGALVCALKNPGQYRSVSAFAPICNPINCPWGNKAFLGYLGDDKDSWKTWDSTELVSKYAGQDLHILIDQGSEDKFYKEKQLLTEAFEEGAKKANVNALVRYQEGYDHSYYFIATFVAEHIAHHSAHLKN